MKKELLFYDHITAKDYLQQLYQNYPYDIEESMVYSLLVKNTYPHPVLLSFISYFETIMKYHIVSKKQEISTSLQQLFLKMSTLSQKDAGVLHSHLFGFEATLQLTNHAFSHPYAHLPFHKIPLIDHIQLHNTPLITMSDYREMKIRRKHSFIYRDISMDASSYVAISIQITNKHGLIFLSRSALSLAIPLCALFHMTTPAKQQDFILIFGLADRECSMEYYVDDTNELYIGLAKGDSSIHHFLHLKNMVLTLYHALRIHQNDLPIHASMIQFELGKQTYGLLFAGERGTGKSEMLAAMISLCQNNNLPFRVLFDDQATLHYLDNEIVCTAIEIATCKALSHQDIQHIFASYAHSIFLQEEGGLLYQIIPLISFEESCCFHKVTHLFYLDNTHREKMMKTIDHLDECINILCSGAFLNQQGLLCHTYFFNPCINIEEDHDLPSLVNEFITHFYLQDIPVFHTFTQAPQYQKARLFKRIAQYILTQILP